MPRKSSSSVRIFYPELSRERLIQRISQSIPELEQKLDIRFLALFGSYAKGNYTVASDIDLLVVYEGQERQDAYALVRKAIELRGLEPHVYSLSQYEEVRETVDQMTQDGLVLLDKR